MLLDPALRARLERLSINTRKRVRAQWSGRHTSHHKGESLDFADYREYVPGDDFRRIDHNLWARLGVLLVRQYEAEEELPVRVVLDASRSMAFYGKFELARTLAAMLSYLGLAGSDRVELTRFPGEGDRHLSVGPSGRHLSAWPRLEAWLEAIVPVGGGELGPAVRGLLGTGIKKGATILVSDLFSSDWREAIDILGVGAGGVVLHVLGIEELRPELAGDLRLADGETGLEVPLSTSEEAMRRYRRTLEAFCSEAAGRARRAGLDYVLVPVGPEAPEQVLLALARAEAVA
jgi:uncharacterized protein (DUF58 family)